MSMETMQWLNTNTLIGFTEKRGNAWHYRAEEQGEQSNHYVGAIPLEDVAARLFAWEAVSGSVTATHMSVIQENGVLTITDPNRQAIMRPAGALNADDLGGILGLFKSGYTTHQYKEWLLNTVADILDDELSIGSAGLLKMGGQAFVQVEVPDNITTPSGVVFRPNLLAATSLDGSLSTTYKRTCTNVVCDNTMAVGLGETGQQIKIRHSKYSHAKLVDVRAALEIVHTIGDIFSEQVEELTNTTVTDDQWRKFLTELVPVPDAVSVDKPGRGRTMAINKRTKLAELYDHDNRVQPWRGTAFGVVQAVNTFAHHVQGSKTGADRGEANMSRAISGEFDKLDRLALETLNLVLA